MMQTASLGTRPTSRLASRGRRGLEVDSWWSGPMPGAETVVAGMGGDDALNADLLGSLRDTGMYNFASEFDIIQEHNGLGEDETGPGGLEVVGINDNGLGSAGDLPSLAVKAEKIAPFRSDIRGDGDLVGKSAVTAAVAAVQQNLARMEKVQTEDPETEPSSPPASAVKRGVGDGVGVTPPPAPLSASATKRRKNNAGGTTPGSAVSTGAVGHTPEDTPGDKAEKNGKGLRHFSMKVCEKVESKQTTTYNEVADELVAEFSKPDDPKFCADQAYDEKNIRRRVYDALNVLMAMEIITKQKKEIMWKGLPATSGRDLGALRAEKKRVQQQIEKKNAYLAELVEQYNSYQSLLQRNAARTELGMMPSGISLPFILVQTKPQATVEVEISEDQQVVHFDFNNTPFQIHDGNFVLANMNLSMENLQLKGENGGTVDHGGEEGMVRDALVSDVHASASAKKNVRGKKKEEAPKKLASPTKQKDGTAARTTRGVKKR